MKIKIIRLYIHFSYWALFYLIAVFVFLGACLGFAWNLLPIVK